MTNQEVYRLMEDPILLTEETLPVLRQIVEDYPYFHTAKLLYLKNLALVEDIRFLPELKRLSVCVPDRKKLFTLIEGKRYGVDAVWTDPFEEKNMDSFALIDDYLSSQPEAEDKAADLNRLLHPSVSTDYIFWSLQKDAEPDTTDAEPATKLQHHDLIDRFIRDEEERGPGSGLVRPAEDKESVAAPIRPEEQTSHMEDSFFTETLARIYVKQKRYEKALQIIKNLNLKYPEKNVYFADQIRFLEKLIINTKK